MPEFRVPGSSSVILMVPGHRMESTVGAALVAALIDRQQYVDIIIQFLVVIPFIFSPPVGRQEFRRWIRAVRHVEDRLLLGRMPVEIATRQAAIPFPVIFRIGGGVDAHITPARLDIALEIGFLVSREQVAGRTEEDDG